MEITLELSDDVLSALRRSPDEFAREGADAFVVDFADLEKELRRG